MDCCQATRACEDGVFLHDRILQALVQGHLIRCAVLCAMHGLYTKEILALQGPAIHLDLPSAWTRDALGPVIHVHICDAYGPAIHLDLSCTWTCHPLGPVMHSNLLSMWTCDTFDTA
jgi:hypothetical protein